MEQPGWPRFSRWPSPHWVRLMRIQTAAAAIRRIDCFTPPHRLPVYIDVADRLNPYSLSETVTYEDNVVRVMCERGFQWDGASIPYWWPTMPWLVTLSAVYLWPGPITVVLSVLLLAYTARLLPYMQRIGRHARAGCVHDKLYRSRMVSRVIADAILMTIMEMDLVPLDVRWQIYLNVRVFGWRAYQSHPLSVQIAAAATVSVLDRTA